MMSALTPKADIDRRHLNVRFVPIADISQVSFDDPVSADPPPVDKVRRRITAYVRWLRTNPAAGQ